MASYECVLVQPTPEELADALAAAVEAANGGARSRMVNGMTGYRAFESAEGLAEADGGGVANCYGYAAHSSATGYAWWTDPAGRLHVRVKGNRLRCSGRHVSTLFVGTRAQQGVTVPAVCQVYPDLWTPALQLPKTALRKDSKEFRTFVASVREVPADAAPRLVFADWLEEHPGAQEGPSGAVAWWRTTNAQHAAAERKAAAAIMSFLAAPAVTA